MCPEFGDIYENPRYIDIISLRKGKQGSEWRKVWNGLKLAKLTL
jgi:hypothetical protein